MELLDAKRRRSTEAITELKAKKTSPNNKVPQNSGKTVAQMLQQKKTLKPCDESDVIEEIEIMDSDSNGTEAVVSTSVRDVIDSVAKGEDQPNGKPKRPEEEKNVSNVSNGSNESDGDDVKRDPSVIIKLPDGLPEDLNILVERIKKVMNKLFLF